MLASKREMSSGKTECRLGQSRLDDFVLDGCIEGLCVPEKSASTRQEKIIRPMTDRANGIRSLSGILALKGAGIRSPGFTESSVRQSSIKGSS